MTRVCGTRAARYHVVVPSTISAATSSAPTRSAASPGSTLPALYIGHGAPPLLDDALWTSQLADLARDLPRPRAILIVSAHWESAPLSLTASPAATPLVYDFGGFPRRFYEMTYETPDASALARLVRSVLPDDEPVYEHAEVCSHCGNYISEEDAPPRRVPMFVWIGVVLAGLCVLTWVVLS